MNWNDLRFVLAVSQARSFLGAAKLLRTTHTTVSRRVATLELQLGTPLFMREKNLCVPTPACARLVIAATKIEDEVQAARRQATEIKEIPAGPVQITSVHWIINELLLPAAPRLHAAFPKLLLRFYGGLYDGPRETPGQMISLRFELRPGRGEEVIPVGNFGYAVYGPAHVEDPESLPWVSFGGSIQYKWLEHRGVRDDEMLITVGDATSVAAAVASGVAKGLVPECMGERNPLLKRLSGPAPEFVRTLRAVGEWRELSSPACQSVISWVETTFADAGCSFAAGEGTAGG